MKFCEKVRMLRKQHKYTQQELANLLGVSLRTITNYESGERYPQRRELYTHLGEIFNVNPDYFLTENDEEPTQTVTQPSPGSRQYADDLIQQVSGLFAGGHLSETDKDAVMRALQEAYWDSKKMNGSSER